MIDVFATGRAYSVNGSSVMKLSAKIRFWLIDRLSNPFEQRKWLWKQQQQQHKNRLLIAPSAQHFLRTQSVCIH